MNVLIIDDDPHVLRVCEAMFKENGHEVVSVEKGQDGINVYSENNHNIDVVVIDILLPDVDGIRVLRKLVEINPNPIKIMFTAYDYRDDFAVWASHAYILKTADGYQKLLETAEKLVK